MDIYDCFGDNGYIQQMSNFDNVFVRQCCF